MIVVLMVMSFIIGYVDRMCQSFFQDKYLFPLFSPLFSSIIFYLIIVTSVIFFFRAVWHRTVATLLDHDL